MTKKIVLGDPIIINGRKLSLSRAVKAGDYIFCTGQVPMKNGNVMTSGTIEEQTIAVIQDIQKTLSLADCTLNDVVKSMVWLSNKNDFPGFNEVYSRYFKSDPPARSAVVNELLVDVKVEIEVIAYKPE
jgi:2-iminobutanoate/2-iminopropanoate deaminase